MNDLPRWIRYVLFVAVTMTTVGIYCLLAARLLPMLRNEPASFLLFPVTLISALAAAAIHPLLDRQSDRKRRLPPMYGIYFLSLVAYALYLWWAVPSGSIGLVLLVIVAGHLYGLPPLAVIVVLGWMMPRLFFAERQRATSR
jgi:hypothetical protein